MPGPKLSFIRRFHCIPGGNDNYDKEHKEVKEVNKHKEIKITRKIRMVL